MQRNTCLIIGTAFLTTVCATAQQIHPRLKSKEFAIQSVAVMPAYVEVTKSGMKGREAMSEAASQLTTKLQEIIANELRARRVKVVGAAKPAAEQDTAMKTAMADVQQKYDGLHPQLSKKPKDVTKGRFTLGDSVAEFHAVEPVQVLAFIRASGYVPTGGKKLMGALVAAGAGGAAGAAAMGPAGFFADIAFVDAKNGEILALASLGTTGVF